MGPSSVSRADGINIQKLAPAGPQHLERRSKMLADSKRVRPFVQCKKEKGSLHTELLSATMISSFHSKNIGAAT